MGSKDRPSKTNQRYSDWFAPSNPGDKSSNLHRLTIGYLGLFLPLFLLIMNKARTTENLVNKGWILDSVSAYYYTGAVGAYIGIIFALAVALFIYEGYGEKFNLNRIVGMVACIAAIFVAFFPTHAPEGLTEPSWWSVNTETIHYRSAVVLFACFIIFSLFLFTRSNTKKGEPLPPDKLGRNVFYIIYGLGMFVCVIWIWRLRESSDTASIFIPEALALELFALSWLVKGRWYWSLVSAKERTVYFIRNPGELVDISKNAIYDLYEYEKKRKDP